MPRLMLSDEYWSKLQKIMLKDRVYNKPEHSKTMEGILFRLRTGCPWRDLPESFGQWSTVYRRFNLWSKKGVLLRAFKSISQLTDLEWEFIDGSIVKAHQHSTGASSLTNEAIGQSVAGNTTKIHLAVDSYGLPIEFDITSGEVHDSKAASHLIKQLPQSDYVIVDKGYDSEMIREQIKTKGSIANI